jgi:hypothetical protein
MWRLDELRHVDAARSSISYRGEYVKWYIEMEGDLREARWDGVCIAEDVQIILVVEMREAYRAWDIPIHLRDEIGTVMRV